MRLTNYIVPTLVLGVGAVPSVRKRHGEKHSNKVSIDQATKLPVVDLGYNLHRANTYDSTRDIYNFTNIRFGAPPLGDLRFRKPEEPAWNRSTAQTGDTNYICPQAFPKWEDQAENFVLGYLLGAFGKKEKRQSRPPAQSNTPVETEDCLFLDVVVPKKVFEAEGEGAPVLVWIYGGGYVAGGKGNSGSPLGLIERSNNSIVYVALNYRVGAFGFLAGPTLMDDGDANAGLWDQRLALQWIQDHIGDFGGNPDKVTVMGESAGGGSIMHQITAFGGHQNSLFQQAIPQSVGIMPMVSDEVADNALKGLIKAANVTSLEELRQVPTEVLQKANALQIDDAPYSNFIYGPVVDGELAPKLPALLLADGEFDTDVKIMVGHNANEGLIFTNPNSVNVSTFKENVRAGLPTISDEALDYLDTTLYPANFSGAYEYKNSILRQAFTAADIGFLCNTYALSKYTHDAYAYEFSIYPALHGLDVPYTFYTGPSGNRTAASTPSRRIKNRMMKRGELIRRQQAVNQAAIALQQWIVSFVKTGVPSASQGPAFQTYGEQQNILQLTTERGPPVAAKDDISAERCTWWLETGYPDLGQDQ